MLSEIVPARVRALQKYAFLSTFISKLMLSGILPTRVRTLQTYAYPFICSANNAFNKFSQKGLSPQTVHVYGLLSANPLSLNFPKRARALRHYAFVWIFISKLSSWEFCPQERVRCHCNCAFYQFVSANYTSVHRFCPGRPFGRTTPPHKAK